jgi:PPOX class probable F420-dependent enzyme
MSASSLAQFKDHQYINVETYRKTGEAVATPVWFVELNNALYVRTGAQSGKIKRIRHTPQIRVAPCDARGNLLGEWVAGQAHIVDEETAATVNQLLKKKYGLPKAFFDTVSRLKKLDEAVFMIELE